MRYAEFLIGGEIYAIATLAIEWRSCYFVPTGDAAGRSLDSFVAGGVEPMYMFCGRAEPMISNVDVHILAEIRSLAERRLAQGLAVVDARIPLNLLMPGKMLRTRLALALYQGLGESVDFALLADMCAATELIHTASLCHDDVIDQALLRRGRDTLWKDVGVSGAILVGDLLLCEAMQLVVSGSARAYLGQVLAKVREVVAAETEQELLLRGELTDLQTCIRMARGKTGPLFALTAMVCGGDDATLSAALEEVGYLIGTAYQLGDDLQDVLGDEQAAGKTLGTDAGRGKYTLPRSGGDGREATREQMMLTCASALTHLNEWPEARDAVAQYLAADLEPVLRTFDHTLSMKDVT